MGGYKPCTGKAFPAGHRPRGSGRLKLPILMLQRCAGLTLGIIIHPATVLPRCSAFSGKAEHPLPFSLQSVAQPLLPDSPFPQLPMTICFMSSLPPGPVSRLSLYSCAVSSDATFFPITSCLIQTFLKAPFHASQLPRVQLPAGLDPYRGSSSAKRGANPAPLPHSIQGVTIHIFISKATPCTSATNPS